MKDDAVYYRSRAQDEIDASMAAESTAARRAHLELAHRYRELADALERREGELDAAEPTSPVA
jgi:hypothetical protein